MQVIFYWYEDAVIWLYERSKLYQLQNVREYNEWFCKEDIMQ